MPRQSTASLSLVRVSTLQPPEPPEELSQAESSLWVKVAASKPADWFQPDNLPLLTEYVRAIVMSDRLSILVETALAGDGGEDSLSLKDLMRLRNMEVQRATSIATKLRLTQQSKYQPRGAFTKDAKAGLARPWQKAAQE